MPSAYAHYRMGSRAIPHLQPEAAACIRSHRHLYELGLHGPDFLFFHDPITKDRLYRLAGDVHKAPGREFFEPAVRRMRLHADGPSLAYLYGVLAHFALDAACHPFINRKAAEGVAGHTEMESEFDRWLLEQDGKPYTAPIAGHLHVDSDADAQTIARFYPHVSAAQVRTCFRRYRFVMDFCTAPEGIRRRLIGSGMFSNIANEFMMTTTANLRCETLTPEIYSRYLQAEKDFPGLMNELQHAIRCGAPLGPAFDRDFG